MRRWLSWATVVVVALALVGLIVGVAAGRAFSSNTEPRYTAHATLALLPGEEVPWTEASDFWEVLTRGQANRTAAVVLSDDRWLGAAARSVGVAESDLTLSAGAIPETTLLEVSVEASEGWAAERVLQAVLDAAVGEAARASGPFAIQTVSAVAGSAVSDAPEPVQVVVAFGLAGLLGGTAVGLILVRIPWRRRRSARTAKVQGAAGSVDDAAIPPVLVTRNPEFDQGSSDRNSEPVSLGPNSAH